MEDCVFCDREKILEDILHETDNFFVKVGLGILTPGHVMVIPKGHYLCYGELPDALEPEYGEIKRWTQEQVTERFAAPSIVEYTPGYGQSIHHAHSHFIPLKGDGYEVQSLLEEMFLPGNLNIEKADRKRLKQIYKQEGKYVSLEEDGTLYVCHVAGLTHDRANPNPHLSYRAFFAFNKGAGVLNWSKMTEDEKIVDQEKRRLTKRLFAA